MMYTGLPAGARRALMPTVEAMSVALAVQPPGKRGRRPQTRSQASSMPTGSLTPQWRMTPTSRTPTNEPFSELERPDPENGHEMKGSSSMMSDMDHIRGRNQ